MGRASESELTARTTSRSRWPTAPAADRGPYGGGLATGGGGPSTGTVIGGSPGISTTVEPITGSCGGEPGGSAGGGGGMPLLVLIVITAPGTV